MSVIHPRLNRHFIFIVVESLFILSWFWQTRLNLANFWPNTFWQPASSDYLIPFVYLSQILFILTIALYLTLHRPHPLTLPKLHLTRHINSLSSTFLIALFLTTLSVALNQPQWWNIWSWLSIIQQIALVIYILIRLRQGIGQRLFILVTISLAAQSLLLIAQWLNQASIGFQWLGEWRVNRFTPGVALVVINGQEFLRPSGTFPHPNVIGVILASLSLPTFWAMRHHPAITTSLKQKYSLIIPYLGWFWLILTSLAIFVTFSRTAWAILALSLIFYFGCHLKSRSINFKTSRLLQSLGQFHPSSLTASRTLILVLILTTLVFVSPLIINRLTSITSYDQLTVDRRLQLNQLALTEINQHPWFGLGPGNFIISTFQYGPLYGVGLWRQPVHNAPLLLAAEHGLPATIAWITTLIFLIITLIKSYASPQASSQPSRHLFIICLWLWLVIILTAQLDHFWLTLHQAHLFVAIVAALSLQTITPKTPTINP